MILIKNCSPLRTVLSLIGKRNTPNIRLVHSRIRYRSRSLSTARKATCISSGWPKCWSWASTRTWCCCCACSSSSGPMRRRRSSKKPSPTSCTCSRCTCEWKWEPPSARPSSYRYNGGLVPRNSELVGLRNRLQFSLNRFVHYFQEFTLKKKRPETKEFIPLD